MYGLRGIGCVLVGGVFLFLFVLFLEKLGHGHFNILTSVLTYPSVNYL
jgi:hypothetical protein